MLQRWLSTIWLGFVAFRYGSTALKAIREPLNPGWDIAWTVVGMTFLLAVMLSAALFKRPVVNSAWLGLGMAATFTVLILSRTVLPAVTALAVFAVSAGFGEFVLQRLRLPSTALLERLVVTVPIGMGFLALGQLLLGIAGIFNSIASWSLMLGLGFPSVLGLRKLLTFRLETGLGKNSLIIFPIGYVFLLNLTWATAPEIQFDAVNVHLAVPRLYLQHGALVDLPYFFHSYFAHLLDMIFGLCLALGGQLVAKFLVLGLGVLAAAGVFVVGRALFSGEAGLWASVIFYTTPLVVWLSSTTYLDLALASFIVASVVAFIRWHESAAWGWLAASGWIAGVATGTKVAALTTLIVLPIFAVRHSRRVRSLAFYLIPFLIVAVPWFLVVYLETGNPFFPYLNAVFRSPQWPLENPSFDARNFGIGTSAAALLRLPFRFTFNSTLFGQALPRGSPGVALLLAFPWALWFVFRGRPIQRTVLAVIGLHLMVWTFTFQYGRYMIPALPFLAVMGCAVFLPEPSGLGRWNRVLLFSCVLAQVSIISVPFVNIPERFPLQRAFGVESEEGFLARSLPGYTAANFLNGVLQPGEKIFGVGVENTRFYLDGPLYTQAEANDTVPGVYELYKIATGADLAAWHMRHRFIYVLASQKDFREPAPFYPFLEANFLKQFGKQLYSDETAVVFRIMPFADSPVDFNLDATGVTFDPPTVVLGGSFTATFLGSNLTDKTYFDLRFRRPGSITDEAVLNWQQGTSATHTVASTTEPGNWVVTSVRPHHDVNDRTGSFLTASTTLKVVSR